MRATTLQHEALAIYQRLGHRRGIAQTFVNTSIIAYWQGDYDHARRFVNAGLAIHRELDDRMGAAYALDVAGMVDYKRGDLARAPEQLAEGLHLFRVLNEHVGTALMLNELGIVAQARGDHREAAALQREGLLLAHRNGDRRRVAFCLEGFAATLEPHQALLAARLFGAAEALRAVLGTPLPPGERAGYAAGVAAIRTHAAPTQWDAAWAEGRLKPLDTLVEHLEKEGSGMWG